MMFSIQSCYVFFADFDFFIWFAAHRSILVGFVAGAFGGGVHWHGHFNARALVRAAVPALGQARALCPCGCDRALDNAIITADAARDPELAAQLKTIAGRVL